MNKKLFHVCNFFYIKVLTYLLHLICIRVRFFVLQELTKYMQLKPILSEYDYKESSVLVSLQGHRFLQSYFITDLI